MDTSATACVRYNNNNNDNVCVLSIYYYYYNRRPLYAYGVFAVDRGNFQIRCSDHFLRNSTP